MLKPLHVRTSTQTSSTTQTASSTSSSSSITTTSVNCEFSDWSAWGKCNRPCNGGNQTRSRTVAVPEVNGGAPCVGDQEEIATCNTQTCAQCVPGWMRTTWFFCMFVCSQYRLRTNLGLVNLVTGFVAFASCSQVITLSSSPMSRLIVSHASVVGTTR